MKEHYCPEEKTTLSYKGECSWCGEKEDAIPAHAVCRSMGCGRKATTLIYDTKGRKQYCCALHNGTKPIKEKSK